MLLEMLLAQHFCLAIDEHGLAHIMLLRNMFGCHESTQNDTKDLLTQIGFYLRLHISICVLIRVICG